MITIPLVRGFVPGSAFGYREGRPIGIEQFLREVGRLAAVLPQRRHILNLCTDRYRFTVGFAAALLRGQTSLLPWPYSSVQMREPRWRQELWSARIVPCRSRTTTIG